MDQLEIQKTIRDFIQQNFIFDSNIILNNSESLLGSGTIDSTGVLELIGFLEEKFKLHFEDEELIAENFDNVDKITSFIQKKIEKQ